LNDPMYIFNSKFDTTNKMEYFLIQLTCIISLLHNNYNKHLMEFLLENNRYLELMDNKITYYIWGKKKPYDEDDMYVENEFISEIILNIFKKFFLVKKYLI